MLAELGHPERELRVVHIGGTNGKGSVSVLTYAALRETGASVGLYTSPHLVDVRERIVVDDVPISREAFAWWTGRLRPAIERTEASFFEVLTAIALADFAARGVDLAVVEVGLGGRLDSTNVVQPLASAVTNIALEHTEYLGNTLDAIAREKAGIAKAGTPFLIGEADAGIATLLAHEAGARGAHPVVTVPPGADYPGPLTLRGTHQRRNAAVAAALLGCLPDSWRPDPAAVAAGFAAARLAGRFDRRGRWIFDVAHNPAGIQVLAHALRAARPEAPIHALVGVLKDKAWREMLSALGPVVDRVWLTTPPTAPVERQWDLAAVKQGMEGDGGGWRTMKRGGVGHPPFVVVPDFDRALSEVQEGAGTVLVTGSFHTVGDALARLPGFAPLG